MKSTCEMSLPNGFTTRQIAAAVSPRMQELIMLPTEKCNFRCTYCYEDFELGKMSGETQRAIELFMQRRMPSLDVLRFNWFGGEPLVAKDVVLRLSRFAKQICDENGVTFSGGLTTNAYLLTSELANELLDCNQNFFQVTLDGWGEKHDEVRLRADGRGTFSIIWANLVSLAALDRDFSVCVRVHVRRENQENLQKLMAEFAKEFRGDKRFYLDFQHLRDMGGTGGKTVHDAVSLDELPAIEAPLRASYQKSLRQVLGLPESTVVNEAPVLVKASNAGESAGSQRQEEYEVGAPYICYATRPNSLLVRSNGRIGKCTVAFDDERNDIGYLGGDGHIVIDNAKLAPWIRGLGTLDLDDVGCPIKYMARSKSESSIKGIPVMVQ